MVTIDRTSSTAGSSWTFAAETLRCLKGIGIGPCGFVYTVANNLTLQVLHHEHRIVVQVAGVFKEYAHLLGAKEASYVRVFLLRCRRSSSSIFRSKTRGMRSTPSFTLPMPVEAPLHRRCQAISCRSSYVRRVSADQ